MTMYYDPKDYGLELVGDAEEEDQCYSFCIFAVWKDAEGTLYWGDDSGCSCPSPFEDYASKNDLNNGTVQDVHNALDTWVNQWDGEYTRRREGPAAELHAKLAAL